jgi:hypothetical protein
MNSIILRVDDVNTTTSPADLERVYGTWWSAGWPVCFSVIPCSAFWFSAEGVSSIASAALTTNRELCAFLREKAGAGLVEIALHGYAHRFGELVARNAQDRLVDGLAALHAALPGLRVRVLVPPHDYLTGDGLKAAHALGLTVCSSWAATHGGGRWAHWQERLRRWSGRPCGLLRAGRLPTDIHLLDFARDETWAKTEAQLRRAWRSGIVPVLTQHYWLIRGERLRRWLAWIGHFEQIPAVQVETYADVLHRHHDV